MMGKFLCHIYILNDRRKCLKRFFFFFNLVRRISSCVSNNKIRRLYINTGTLQFRQASDTEEEDLTDSQKHKPPKVSLSDITAAMRRFI